MKSIYIILMIIVQTLAELETCDITEIKNWNVNLNKLVDHYNPTIVQFINKYGLDPLRLAESGQRLWLENPNLSEPMYKFDLILRSGILKGLSDLKRYNNATLTYADKLLKLDIGFEFKLLKGMYNYVLKLFFRTLEGRIIALAENVRTVINITFNTTDYILTLDKFDLQVPGRIKITIENKDGSLDWINTAIVTIIAPFLKATITNTIQKEASNAIRTYLNKINYKVAPGKTLSYVLKYQLKQSLTNVHQQLIF